MPDILGLILIFIFYMKNILFVCSHNQWRSPTAEKVIGVYEGVTTRSVGTSSRAKKPIAKEDIKWADFICVMEIKHKQQIQAKFTRLLQYKKIYVLGILDDYVYGDPQLVTLIENKLKCLRLI
tara:strand:+ start:6470 stop:6838 length:369 start_codon:yes stop_codon:yes gene_type:complete